MQEYVLSDLNSPPISLYPLWHYNFVFSSEIYQYPGEMDKMDLYFLRINAINFCGVMS